MDDPSGCSALIVAGGSGQRMGGSTRKQFLLLDGEAILKHTLQAFDRHPRVHALVVVLPKEEHAAREQQIRRQWGMHKPLAIVVGGEERQTSVQNGLHALSQDGGLVLVHDGVRPLVSAQLIDRVIESARINGAAVPGLPVRETVKEIGDGWVHRTLMRQNLVAVQTPQGFRIDILRAAYEQAKARNLSATDDSALVEELGVRVAIVDGEERNIKITTRADLAIAEWWLLQEKKDAHRSGI